MGFIAAGIISVILLVYLIYAVINPERF